jgi:hypothetical protein
MVFRHCRDSGFGWNYQNIQKFHKSIKWFCAIVLSKNFNQQYCSLTTYSLHIREISIGIEDCFIFYITIDRHYDHYILF